MHKLRGTMMVGCDLGFAPGPWIDATKAYNEACEKYFKLTGRWWHVTQRESLCLLLIVSEPLCRMAQGGRNRFQERAIFEPDGSIDLDHWDRLDPGVVWIVTEEHFRDGKTWPLPSKSNIERICESSKAWTVEDTKAATLIEGAFHV